jgi:hypothetical protein
VENTAICGSCGSTTLPPYRFAHVECGVASLVMGDLQPASSTKRLLRIFSCFRLNLRFATIHARKRPPWHSLAVDENPMNERDDEAACNHNPRGMPVTSLAAADPTNRSHHIPLAEADGQVLYFVSAGHQGFQRHGGSPMSMSGLAKPGLMKGSFAHPDCSQTRQTRQSCQSCHPC